LLSHARIVFLAFSKVRAAAFNPIPSVRALRALVPFDAEPYVFWISGFKQLSESRISHGETNQTPALLMPPQGLDVL
jgi:hypothetical protein